MNIIPDKTSTPRVLFVHSLSGLASAPADDSDDYEDSDLHCPTVHPRNIAEGVRRSVFDSFIYVYCVYVYCDWQSSPPKGNVPTSAHDQSAAQLYLQWWWAVGWWWWWVSFATTCKQYMYTRKQCRTSQMSGHTYLFWIGGCLESFSTDKGQTYMSV